MKLSQIQTPNSDFFSFFGIHQVSTTPMLGISILRRFKPGGFQENIDIEIVEDLNEEMLSASLLIDRSWLGNAMHLNPFGMDIAKSFLVEFVHPEDKNRLKTLPEDLFQLHGENDELLSVQDGHKISNPNSELVQKIGDVFFAKSYEYELKLSACKMGFRNLQLKEKKRFEIGIMYNNLFERK